MLSSEFRRRLSRWVSLFRSTGSGGKNATHRSRHNNSRLLRAESLEQRDLLSVVAGMGSETFKAIPFSASGGVVSDYTQAGYRWHLTGTANLTQGVIVYDSVSHGTIAKRGTTHGAMLAVNNGSYTATGKSPNFSGSWRLNGYTDNIVDQTGQLTGTTNVESSSMQIPTQPTVTNSFKGTYNLQNATLNTSNFAMAMDLVQAGGTAKITFKGTLTPTGNPFDVVVTPTWNADWTVNVGVRVPGQPHKTATANRNTPVTNVQVYWAQGTTLKSAALDNIPVYWNEASGSYKVDITNYPAIPAGATNLAFVTRFDGKTKIATLALPTVSIGAASVAEGNSNVPAERSHAKIPVTLPRAFLRDVTVSYTTFVGTNDTAKPGTAYVATTNSLIIHAGDTRGEIDVPIVGNTRFEPNKTFSVKLTQVRGAVLNPARSQAICTITNDDSKPTLTVANVSKLEGTPRGTTGRTTNFVFNVTLSNPTYQQLTLNYQTANGTATLANQDYVYKKSTLTIAPGATTATFTIVVNANAVTEADETFFVNLSVPTGQNVTIATPRVTGTILNDDPAPAAANASRNTAISQMAGIGQLASIFDPLDREKKP